MLSKIYMMITIIFDDSNFSITYLYFFNENNKVNGKLKCENSDKIIEEFCGLRSKCYAFRYTSEDTEK